MNHNVLSEMDIMHFFCQTSSLSNCFYWFSYKLYATSNRIGENKSIKRIHLVRRLAIASGCLSEVEDKTQLLKTPLTSDTGLRES